MSRYIQYALVYFGVVLQLLMASNFSFSSSNVQNALKQTFSSALTQVLSEALCFCTIAQEILEE